MEATTAKASSRQETAPSPRAPALPWSVRLQLMALMGATDLAARRDGTVNRFAFGLADRQARASARPDKSAVRSSDVVVDASRGLWARVFSPASASSSSPPLPVVIYFHGGGFTFFSAASVPLDAMCRRMCRAAGVVVVSVNYRLAPEHPYPAAYEDGVDVLRYLSGDAGGLPPDLAVAVDLSRCFLTGDSAGGNIAHHVAQRWTAASFTSPTPVRLAGVVLLQPFFGGEERTDAELRLDGVAPVVSLRRSDWSWRAFLPPGADRNHPAAHVTGEPGPELPDGFPPVMLVVGGFDPLQDWHRRYAAALRRKGKAVRVVELPEAFHGFYIFPELADSGKVMQEIKAFVKSSTSIISGAAAE